MKIWKLGLRGHKSSINHAPLFMPSSCIFVSNKHSVALRLNFSIFNFHLLIFFDFVRICLNLKTQKMGDYNRGPPGNYPHHGNQGNDMSWRQGGPVLKTHNPPGPQGRDLFIYFRFFFVYHLIENFRLLVYKFLN